MKAICSYCGKEFEKRTGHLNRANKLGLNVYCDRTCSGFGRRDNKTVEQKKIEKSEYDKEYRERNFEKKRQQAHEYFAKDYATNPEKYKAIRKNRYPKHLKHLQTDKYRKWKRDYDQKHLAKKDYGVFWEASLLLKKLEDFLIENTPDGMKFQMGITNKTQKRKRLWQRQNKTSSQQRA